MAWPPSRPRDRAPGESVSAGPAAPVDGGLLRCARRRRRCHARGPAGAPFSRTTDACWRRVGKGSTQGRSTGTTFRTSRRSFAYGTTTNSTFSRCRSWRARSRCTLRGGGALDRLDGNQVRSALAFHYCTRGVHEAPWYAHVVRSRPKVVADVLVRCASSPLKRNRQDVAGLDEVAGMEDHAEVARHAVLPLLRAYPLRAAVKTGRLDALLWSALRYADGKSLAGADRREVVPANES